MKKIIRWLLGLFYWRKKTPPIESNQSKKVFTSKIVSELPEEVEDNVIYIEGNKDKNDFWFGLLKCPCGCGEKIMLNLMDDAEPYWKIHLKNNNLSITPSIWRTKNCKSHFFLRNNKIVWSNSN